MKYLIEKGASLDIGRSPLTIAAFGGDTDAIAYFLSKGANVNKTFIFDDKEERSPLLNAVCANKYQAAKLLLESKADPNLQYQWNMKTNPNFFVSALQISIDNMNTEIGQLLIDHGANVNATVGKEPLIVYTAARGCIEEVKLLLENGANPNARGDNGVTALIRTISFRKNPRIVGLLLSYGADPRIEDNLLKKDAFSHAQDGQNDLEVIKLLNTIHPQKQKTTVPK